MAYEREHNTFEIFSPVGANRNEPRIIDALSYSAITVFGETEASSAGVQLAEG
jgi:hypothetical protein